MARVFRKFLLRQDLIESGHELPHTATRVTQPLACYTPRLTPRRTLLMILCLILFLSVKFVLPPSYSDIRKLERSLPQHDLELQPPEGKNGRYLRFPGYHKGVGWNNVLEELIIHSFLASCVNRSYVFEDYTWHQGFSPFVIDYFKFVPSRIPLNAFISGPSAGGIMDDDHTQDLQLGLPRAVNNLFWEEVCPPSRRITFIPENIPRDSDGASVIDWWIEQISAFRDKNCLQIDPSTLVFPLNYYSDPKILSLWPLLAKSPILRYFQWSPLVIAALEKNAHLFGLRDPSLYMSSDTLKGLLTIHIRRGDFVTHCHDLMRWGLKYQAFNTLPGLLDKFELPADNDEIALQQYYLSHCWPTIPEIVIRLRTVRREYLQLNPSSSLNHVYILTNGKPNFLDRLTNALFADGWFTIHTTLDMLPSLTREQYHVSAAIDMAIAEKAEVFVGNGFSSLTSNVVLIRMAKGLDPWTNRML